MQTAESAAIFWAGQVSPVRATGVLGSLLPSTATFFAANQRYGVRYFHWMSRRPTQVLKPGFAPWRASLGQRHSAAAERARRRATVGSARTSGWRVSTAGAGGQSQQHFGFCTLVSVEEGLQSGMDAEGRKTGGRPCCNSHKVLGYGDMVVEGSRAGTNGGPPVESRRFYPMPTISVSIMAECKGLAIQSLFSDSGFRFVVVCVSRPLHTVTYTRLLSSTAGCSCAVLWLKDVERRRKRDCGAKRVKMGAGGPHLHCVPTLRVLPFRTRKKRL